VLTVGGRLDFTGSQVRPFDEEAAVAAARWFRNRAIDTIGVCFLHAYANPDHELRMREVLRREHPTRSSRSPLTSCASTASTSAASPRSSTRRSSRRVSAYVRNIRTRLDAHRPGVPFYVMKSNGGVLSADEVVHQPITTVLSGRRRRARRRARRRSGPVSTAC
jgi:N-methylhydantoinase A